MAGRPNGRSKFTSASSIVNGHADVVARLLEAGLHGRCGPSPHHAPTARILQITALQGGKPELVAWGFRNPFGLAFSPKGQLSWAWYDAVVL